MSINITEEQKEVLLDARNDEIVKLMIPVFVYLSVLMIVGFFGNTMVCVYYGCVAKKTTHSIFIVTLAVFDLLSCSISIPTEIADSALYYKFSSNIVCKLLRFNNHFLTISSALTLLAIAVDRYRRICFPAKKQLSKIQAKYCCFAAAVVSIALSWPAFIMYDTETVSVKNDLNVTIYGKDCSTTTDDNLKSITFAISATYGVIFVVATIFLATLYGCIGRVMYMTSKTTRSYSLRPPSDQNGVSSIRLNSDPPAIPRSGMKGLYRRRPSTAQVIELTTFGHIQQATEEIPVSVCTNSLGRLQSRTPDASHFKYTIIMFVITTIFILSFLPYLVLVIWWNFSGRLDDLSPGELVAFDIGMRSFFVNSAVNPLIYGLFNPKFRKYFRSVSFCRRERGNRTSTESTKTLSVSSQDMSG